MGPSSSTVENYLKAISQAQLRLPRRGDLVPMGQLAHLRTLEGPSMIRNDRNSTVSGSRDITCTVT